MTGVSPAEMVSPAPMRVLTVLWDGRWGGPQKHVLMRARRLASRGIETILVLPTNGSEWAEGSLAEGVQVERIPLGRIRGTLSPRVHLLWAARFFSDVGRLRELIRKTRADVVHSYGLRNLQAAVAARRARIPLVWHLNDTSTPAPMRRLLMPLYRRWATGFAADARAVAAFHGVEDLVLGENGAVLYPPLDLEAAASEPSSRRRLLEDWGVQDDEDVVVTLANVNPVKGLEYLVEAARRLSAGGKRIHFLVAGAILETRERYYRSLQAQVHAAGLDDRIRFLGMRHDVSDILAAADLYVHPSIAEGCPTAVMEASAAGLPVVVTRVGGVPEIVVDGDTGLIVAPASPDSLVAAIASLLNDVDRRQRLGTAGREYVRERFGVERSADAQEGLYRRVVGQSSRSRPIRNGLLNRAGSR